MEPWIILVFIGAYFGILFLIAFLTGKGADNQSFFIGNRKSHWYLIALGLIGDSLSGVTFISVPGTVATAKFYYLQIVFGYFVGYWVISQVLLPLYYKLQLTSIYSYLQQRFGQTSQKTGSFFFLISRLVGAAGRLFLAVQVIQYFVFDQFHISFEITVFVMIALMLLYTFKGGIKTLVWTDTFQSVLLLFGLIASIVAIAHQLEFNAVDLISAVWNSSYNEIIMTDPLSKTYFWKQFLGGAFIAIAMTGLDQNMMQKNLSCPSLKDAQKNIHWFSFVMVAVNILFVAMGALLFIYAENLHISLPMVDGKLVTDQVFPTLALHHLGSWAAIAFIVGLTAATFSSADSVLTTLTTSFCIDFLKFETNTLSDAQQQKIRKITHIGFSLLLYLVILLFKAFNDKAIIDTILSLANYTYGPLLGLFAFGLFTTRTVLDYAVPLVCLSAPIISYYLATFGPDFLGGYQFGYELLIINGLLTFGGLLLISKPKKLNVHA